MGRPAIDPAILMALWRYQAIYKEQAATAECVNALARNRGLRQFLVRGVPKVNAVWLWFALAHNRGLQPPAAGVIMSRRG